MRKGAFALAATLVALICCSGGSTNLNILNYDRECPNASVCVLVATDACCGCPESAINSSSLTQYNADLAAAKMNCGGMSCSNMACPNLVPGCSGGVCTSEPAPSDAGTD
jgi:hypothetical protein